MAHHRVSTDIPTEAFQARGMNGQFLHARKLGGNVINDFYTIREPSLAIGKNTSTHYSVIEGCRNEATLEDLQLLA